MEESLRNSTVLVTGGAGFLGGFIVEKLRHRGVRRILVPRSSKYDLTKEQQVAAMFGEAGGIDIVIHAAASIGGIGFNKKYPGTVFYNNAMMNTLTMDYARRNHVKKFVGIGSVCAYPKYASIPFEEENLWDGYPEETNASYGLTKKMMLVQGQSYGIEFGFKAIHCLMINLYGPRDNFHPEYSHVVPALIRKFVDAKNERKDKVIVWGTGEVSREFLYVEDAAEAVVLATARYSKPEPLNIGIGKEIKIRELVDLIQKMVGFEGEVRWDTSRPDGQPRRCLDTSKARAELDFEAKTTLKEGLQRTIEYYRSTCGND